MLLINCKVQLKLKWTRCGILPAAGNENKSDKDYNNANNTIFTIKDTKLIALFVTLSARGNQKLSKGLSKWFERSVIAMSVNQTVRIEKHQINIDIFLNQILLELIDVYNC